MSTESEAPTPAQLEVQLLTERLLRLESTVTVLRTSLFRLQMTIDGIINLFANSEINKKPGAAT